MSGTVTDQVAELARCMKHGMVLSERFERSHKLLDNADVPQHISGCDCPRSSIRRCGLPERLAFYISLKSKE